MSSECANSPSRRYLILGTAGHIDHGKTTLIKACTGTNTDRLPEEKRRGMTIELGFAELSISDITFGIVDVPGHERFVRTMVSGATGVDVALIIVAADDSVMPQTREHVEILSLLGISRAVVAITKCDLVDEEMVQMVESDVCELLERNKFDNTPIVHVASTEGRGIEELKSKLLEVSRSVGHERMARAFRLPIDRVFTVPGRGTVVTGSVVSGRCELGESVAILPGDNRARIREIQTHGRMSTEIRAGQRGAVNLQGVNRDDLERGCELVASGTLAPSVRVDARITSLASHRQTIRNNSRLRLCLGTKEVIARCVILSAKTLEPGKDAYVQLRCREPVVAAFRQRFILRNENATGTIGGGIVLRTNARRVSVRMDADVKGLEVLHQGDEQSRIAEAVRYARFSTCNVSQLALATGTSINRAAQLLDDLVSDKSLLRLPGLEQPISSTFLSAFETRALRWLENYHRMHPDEPGCLAETLTGWLEQKSGSTSLGKTLGKRLIDSGHVKVMGRYVCLKQFAPALSRADETLLSTMLDLFRNAMFQPPTTEELTKTLNTNKQRVEKLLKVACSTQQLAKMNSTFHLHAEAESELHRKVRHLYSIGGPFTVSALREELGSSRKYVVPISEYLDRTGFTKRVGDARIVVEDVAESNGK